MPEHKRNDRDLKKTNKKNHMDTVATIKSFTVYQKKNVCVTFECFQPACDWANPPTPLDPVSSPDPSSEARDPDGYSII